MKPPFEVVDFKLEVISRLAVDAYDFCHLWRGYLTGCGWTEEEYEQALEQEVFPTEVAN